MIAVVEFRAKQAKGQIKPFGAHRRFSQKTNKHFLLFSSSWQKAKHIRLFVFLRESTAPQTAFGLYLTFSGNTVIKRIFFALEK